MYATLTAEIAHLEGILEKRKQPAPKAPEEKKDDTVQPTGDNAGSKAVPEKDPTSTADSTRTEGAAQKEESRNKQTKAPEVKSTIDQDMAADELVNDIIDADQVLQAEQDIKKRQRTFEKLSGQTETETQAANAGLNQRLTTPDPNDAGKNFQFINVFRAHMKARKDAPGVLQSIPDFYKALDSMIETGNFTEIDHYFENGVSLELVDWLKEMRQFHEKFAGAVDKLFLKHRTTDKMDFRYEDPLQYLVDENGKVDEGVVAAMSSVAFNWLATRGSETLRNDESQMPAILGLDKETAIPAEYVHFLEKLGVNQNMMYANFGNDIFKLLGVSPAADAPKNFKARVETALGQFTTLALTDMNYLEVKRVYTGDYINDLSAVDPINDTPGERFGMSALADNIRNYYSKAEERVEMQPVSKRGVLKGAFYAHVKDDGKPSSTDTKGKVITSFYKVLGDTEGRAIESIRKLQAPARKVTGAWDKLFTQEQSEYAYSFDPFEYKEGTRLPIGHTGQYAAVDQSANLIKNMNQAYEASPSFMSAFFVLGRENQLKVLGNTDITKVHKENRKSVEASNEKNKRDILRMRNWFIAADARPDKRRSKFYVPAAFGSNGRMTQRGEINPQNSKLHRYAFSLESWKRSIPIGKRLTKKEKRFMEAVALGLGLEAGKMGGLKPVLKELKSLLLDPIPKNTSAERVKKITALRDSVEALAASAKSFQRAVR